MVVTTQTSPSSVGTISSTPYRPRQVESWTRLVLDDDEEEEDDDYDFQDFMELQRSTGSDIPNAELQKQIDDALSPDSFLDAHIQDASFMEKVAMSSIPQQLPRPAVAALSKRKSSRKKSKSWTLPRIASLQNKNWSLESSFKRVSHFTRPN